MEWPCQSVQAGFWSTVEGKKENEKDFGGVLDLKFNFF